MFTNQITVNQLLFVTTLFRNLLLINWFATTNDSDQVLSRQQYNNDWFTTRNIYDDNVHC